MNNPKNTAKIVGILILTAYGVLVSEFVESKYIVFIADVISGFSVIGIAVLLSAYFKPVNKNLTLVYLGVKILEGLLMVVGGFAYLFINLQYLRAAIYDGIHTYAFIIGGYLLYYLIIKSKIVPKFIGIWGLLAISALLLTTILKFLGISYPSALDGLLVLIITNEVFMAFWLLIKGFNKNI